MSDRERPTSSPEGAKDERDVREEPFLRRWSRLKADSAVRPADVAGAGVPTPAPHDPAAEARDDDAAGERGAETLPPGDDDMPPIESLTHDSDFSGFMSPRVSAALRKQALRKLFRSSKFNVISDMDDYTEDFRNFPALGDVVTADMKHAAKVLLEKQLQAARDAGTEGAEAAGAEATQDGETLVAESGATASAATADATDNTAAADAADAADAEARDEAAETTQDDDEELTRNA